MCTTNLNPLRALFLLLSSAPDAKGAWLGGDEPTGPRVRVRPLRAVRVRPVVLTIRP